MSILLEALRKSEKDKRRVKAPSIHSGEQSKPLPVISRKGWLLFIFIVIVVCVVSIAWVQFSKPNAVYEPPVTLTSDSPGVASKDSGKPLQDGDSGSSMTVAANKPGSRQRTPVETFQRSNEPTSVLPASSKDVSGPVESDKKPAAVGRQNSGTSTAKKQGSNRPPPGKAVAKKNAMKKPAKAEANVVSQKKFRPKPPAPISYWELPDVIRAKVPEMKFTVLVFDPDPKQRWVLIDGQRFRQGEQVQPELFVKRIHRNGVVFKYRLYMFFVER